MRDIWRANLLPFSNWAMTGLGFAVTCGMSYACLPDNTVHNYKILILEFDVKEMRQIENIYVYVK